MKWIIFSKNSPAQLHALIESALWCIPSIRPTVVFDAVMAWSSPEVESSYELVSQRFVFKSFAYQSGWWTFKDAILNTAYEMRHNGTPEPMILFTTESMVFSGKVDTRAVWGVLKDHNLLGVSLTRNHPDQLSRHSTIGYDWSWNDVDTPAFSLGTVYRTSDVMGPLLEHTYNSPAEMCGAVSCDASFARRPRMACLHKPALLDMPVVAPSESFRYLNGEVLRLAEDKTRLQWGPYLEKTNG